MEAPENETSRTRWTLINRLKQWDDSTSWNEFFELYWKLIYAVAIQSGLSAAEAEEVVQETVITVAKKMPTFNADPACGSFKGWLLQLTRRRIIDQLRKRPPPGCFQPHGQLRLEGDGTATIDRVPAPETVNLENRWDAEWRKNLLEAATQRVRQRVNPRHYKIFYLHVLKKQPALQVARALNVNLAQVYLAKSRIARQVRKEVQRLEKELN